MVEPHSRCGMGPAGGDCGLLQSLIGYGAHQNNTFLFMIFPLAVAVSFFLIADIDSPRGGIIRVHPQNLTSLSQSLHARATAPPHD